MPNYLAISSISIALAFVYTSVLANYTKDYKDIPTFYIIVLAIHLIQFIAFIPAKILSTQKFYDLTGSLTYISCILFSIYSAQELVLKQKIAAALVLIWAVRLGSFLFYRVIKTGQDSRFVKIKKSTIRFFTSWCLQGLWVTLTAGDVLLFLNQKQTSSADENLGALQILGIMIWIVGFLIELGADTHKFIFNQNPNNKDKFISSGLWKYSRHPNYCGEIILWSGLAVFLVRSFTGWEYLSLISPVFVYFLLTKLSGVPLLEDKADKKWGNSPQYRVYKQNTPVMFPSFKQIRANQSNQKRN